MRGRCHSNPAQYERNRRFGHLVHALGRAAGGAKLPSVGLCLNASKAESALGRATITGVPKVERHKHTGQPVGPRHYRRQKAVAAFVKPNCREGCVRAAGIDITCRVPSRTVDQAFARLRNPESPVDDLSTWPGVVNGRAVATLRSVETLPWLGDSSCLA
jgi:hypothetical protein